MVSEIQLIVPEHTLMCGLRFGVFSFRFAVAISAAVAVAVKTRKN